MIDNLVEKIDNLEKTVEKLVERVVFLKKVLFLCKISTIVKFWSLKTRAIVIDLWSGLELLDKSRYS